MAKDKDKDKDKGKIPPVPAGGPAMNVVPLPSPLDGWNVERQGIQFIISKEHDGEYGMQYEVGAYDSRGWGKNKQIGGMRAFESLDDALIACWLFDRKAPWPE